MNVIRASVKGVLVLVALCSLPFLIELLLNAYELNRNPWTQLGAIVTDGGAVNVGLNRRAFNEVRFRSTNMRVYLTATELSEREADAFVSGITGTLRVLKEGQEQLAYAFKLEKNLRRNVGGLDALEELSGTAVMDIADKFDVECRIEPATEADAVVSNALFRREFGVGEAVEFAFVFNGNIPSENTLRFSYSQCPRSLFHGTFLERLANRFKRIFG